MTNNDDLALKLKAAAEKATSLNLDSAEIQRGSDGYYECPVCCGAGEVEAKADFCNIDGLALGVQFYGIGEHHGAAEEYFRAAAPANILDLLAERDADKMRIEMLEEYVNDRDAQNQDLLLNIGSLQQRIAELVESHKQLREAMAIIHNTIRMDGAYTPLAAIMSRAKRAYEESAVAAGINLEVGE